MSYVPKPDVEGINNTETNPLKDIFILVVGFLVVSGILIVSLAMAGEFLLSRVSLEREMSWFSSINWFKDKEAKKLNVLILEDMAEKLAPDPKLKFEIDVVCEESPNAFAFPGGQISITSGLLKEVKSERGLAFVLAHEIGHIVNRHHIRGLGFQLGIAVGSAFLGLDASGGIGGSLLTDVIGRTHSRGSEAEADAFALSAMKRAYGTVDGAEEFFEVVEKDMPAWINAMPSWMSTHPGTSERLKVIREASKSEKGRGSAKLERHGLMPKECK